MIATGDRISSAYLSEQVALHAAPRGYGGRGNLWANAVAVLIYRFIASSVLDYGCGQGTLVAELKRKHLPGIRYAEYDPAVAGKSSPPAFADLVICTDVLEHVEPDKLDAVLMHLKQLARKAVFAVIALRPSNKTLSDGRNAHLIIEPADWWIARLTAAGFRVLEGPPKIPGRTSTGELSLILETA